MISVQEAIARFRRDVTLSTLLTAMSLGTRSTAWRRIASACACAWSAMVVAATAAAPR